MPPSKQKRNEGIDTFLENYPHIKDKTPKHCYFSGCKKRSHGFNIKGGLGYGEKGGDRISCKRHKKDTFAEQNKLCIYIECEKRGHQYLGNHRFCTEHLNIVQLEGQFGEDLIVREKHIICKEDGCNLSASFDKGTKCQKHAKSKKSDERRRCLEPGCVSTNRPTFGFPGEAKIRCNDHKKEGMISRKTCNYSGCNKSASYGKNGIYEKCLDHIEDGDVLILKNNICSMPCCMYEDSSGQYNHPELENKRICVFAARVMVEDAIMSNNLVRMNYLKNLFKMKRLCTLNAQSAFRIECERWYNDLLEDCCNIYFDSQVKDGPKLRENKRPDIFYKWVIGDNNFAIHLEYDETSRHEDDLERINTIHKDSQCDGRTYLIRIQGGHNTINPLCKDVLTKYYKYFDVTSKGKKVAITVANLVKERIVWIKNGLKPDCNREYRVDV